MGPIHYSSRSYVRYYHQTYCSLQKPCWDFSDLVTLGLCTGPNPLWSHIGHFRLSPQR